MALTKVFMLLIEDGCVTNVVRAVSSSSMYVVTHSLLEPSALRMMDGK